MPFLRLRLFVSLSITLVIATILDITLLPFEKSEFRMFVSDEISVEIPAGVTEGKWFTLRVTDHKLQSATAHFEIFENGVDEVAAQATAKVEGQNHAFDATIRPHHAGTMRVEYVLRAKDSSDVFTGTGYVYVNATLVHRLSLFLLLATLAFVMIFGALVVAKKITTSRQERLERVEAKIEEAEIKAEKEPEKAKFAWDLARVKLEAYFDRNLFQVNQVFIVAIFVMCVGFAFVLCGVILAFKGLKDTSWVAAVSGIITQFIGATFMVIYRSTMSQANEFMTILERINSVGMAVQVLDSIPESEPTLKNQTRAQIVELLLSSNASLGPKRRPDEQK